MKKKLSGIVNVIHVFLSGPLKQQQHSAKLEQDLFVNTLPKAGSSGVRGPRSYVVNVYVTWGYLTQRICIPDIYVVPRIDQRYRNSLSADRQTHGQTYRRSDIHTDRHTHGQTYTRSDIHTDKLKLLPPTSIVRSMLWQRQVISSWMIKTPRQNVDSSKITDHY